MPSSVTELEHRPEAKNLIGIYSSLTNSSLEQSVIKYSGKNFSEFKNQLSQVLVEKIEPISQEIKKLLSDQKYLDDILNKGFENANSIASKKVEKIKEIIGF
jgi:tryptophanyl-tRNA synthetase